MKAVDRAVAAEARARELEARARSERARASIKISRVQSQMMRGFVNTGYSESGASRVKKSMKGWNANSRSPQEDIDANLHTLIQRSRDLYMSSPLATSAIKTNRTNVVGSGLVLNSRIDYKYLGLTREQADEWKLDVAREFGLWANDVWCDSARLNNFYELQQIALISWLMNGDGFGLIKREDSKPWMPYGLRLHLIEGDRVSTPNTPTYVVSFYNKPYSTVGKTANGNPIYNGVEVDKDTGAVVAYHICNQYPGYSSLNGVQKKWERVLAFGEKTGNPNIIHLMEAERCEQYRGVPYLAPVIESLKQITRYTEAELMAAVVQSFFTAFITVKSPTSDDPLGSSIEEGQEIETDENAIEMGPGTVNVLGEGEDVKFGDPSRPSSGFEPFVNAMAKYIGAALEIPHELLTKSFMASYSASRAALLEAWKAFRMRRTWFANDFCQPVYRLWLEEAVAIGRIKAPGFFNDPLIKNAWCQAEWNGPAAGQLDPVKEVDAATKRVEQGFSTRERETIELTGGDWGQNVAQLERENELLEKANGSQKGGSAQNAQVTNITTD